MSRVLFKNTSVVGLTTLLSRVTGLMRDMVYSQAFGAGTMMDAFLVAYKIPNFLRRLFAEGAFSQSFVPVISEFKVRRSQDEVRELVAGVQGTLGVVLLIVSGVWLIMTDPWLGLFAFMVFPLMLATNILYQRKVDYHYQVAQDELGALSEAAHESFDGVLVVKAFGAEDRETERLAVISRRLRKARTNAITLRSTFESLIDAAPSLVNIAIIAFGAVRVRDGAMTVGELSAFVFLFTLVSLPLRIVSYLFSELPHAASGWARVQQVLNEPLTPNPRTMIGKCPDAMVDLRRVSAGHVDSLLALRDVSLRVERGHGLFERGVAEGVKDLPRQPHLVDDPFARGRLPFGRRPAARGGRFQRRRSSCDGTHHGLLSRQPCRRDRVENPRRLPAQWWVAATWHETGFHVG